jgi:hypothetical protein
MTSFFSPGPGTKPTLNHRRFMFLPKKLGLLLILTIQPSSMEMSTPFTSIVDVARELLDVKNRNGDDPEAGREVEK